MPLKSRGRGVRGRPKKKQPGLANDQGGLNVNTKNHQQPSSASVHTPTSATSAKYKPREERSYKDFFPDLNINRPLFIIRESKNHTTSTQQDNVTSTKSPSLTTTSKTSLVDLTGQDITNSSTPMDVSTVTGIATASTTSADTDSLPLSVNGTGAVNTISRSPSTSSTPAEQGITTSTTSTSGALWKESLDESRRQDDTYPALSSRLQVHHTTESGAVDLTALPKPNFKKVTGDMETAIQDTPTKTKERHINRRRDSHQADDNMDGNDTTSVLDSEANDNETHEITDDPLTTARSKDYSRPERHYIRYTEPTEEALFDMVEYDMDEQDEAWLKLLNMEREKENLGQVSCSFFENVIDKLEKEWFDLVKHLPKQAETGATVPEDSTCAICEDGECENSNAIVFCDGCNLAVHQDCYGVPYIPEGQWLCRKCMVSPDKPVSCLFCPNEGGAFKQTNTNKWGHLLCAIWIPEIGVSNSVYMEPIDNIESIPKSRWKLNCYICNKRYGACIQCDNKHCFTAFHVTCARWARLCMRMKSHGAHYDSVLLKAYCDKHTPRDYRDEVDVDRSVLAAQNFFGPKSHKSRGRPRINYTSKQRHVDEVVDLSITDDEFNGEDDNIDDMLEQPYHGRGSTSKNLKRKGKQPHSKNKKRKTYSISGAPSLKAARAHQHHYSAGAPIAPDFILTKLENIKSVRQAPQLRKKSDLLATICRYWSLKRESRRGAPLLKRLHLEPWTASSSQFKKNEFDMAYRAEAMMILRSDLERVRMLSEQVQKREKLKLERLRRQKEYIERILFPVEYIVKPILNQLMEMDKKEFFFYPVTPDVAPDYHEVIENPMAFSDIIEKLNGHEYSTIDAVEADLSLIWANSKAYNRMETLYYRLAHRMEQVAVELVTQAQKEFEMLAISRQTGALETNIDSGIFTYDLASSTQLQTIESASDSSHHKEPETMVAHDEPLYNNRAVSTPENEVPPADITRTTSTTKVQQTHGVKQKDGISTQTQMKRGLRTRNTEDVEGIPSRKRKTRVYTKAPPMSTPPRKSKRLAAAIPTAESTTSIEPIVDIETTAPTGTIETTEKAATIEKASKTTQAALNKKVANGVHQETIEERPSNPSQPKDSKSASLTPLSSSSSSLGSSLSSASVSSTTTPSSSSPPLPPSPTSSTPTKPKNAKNAAPNRRVLRSAGPAEMPPPIKNSTNHKNSKKRTGTLSNELKNLQMMEPVRHMKGTRKSLTLRAPRGYQYLSPDDETDNDEEHSVAQQVKDKKTATLANNGNGSRTRKPRFSRIEFDIQPIRDRPRRILSAVSVSPPPSATPDRHQQKPPLPAKKTKATSKKSITKVYKAKPGDIVWARVSGFPFHPADIVDLEQEGISKHIMKQKTPGRDILVKFYKVPENHQWGWVKSTDVHKFGNDQDDRAMLEKAKIKKGKQKARYGEVLKAYQHVKRKVRKIQGVS